MKTKSILMLVVLMGINFSCDKYLEEKLVSDVSASYYTTAAGLDDGLDATYFYLKYLYSNERAFSVNIFGTDTYTAGADGGYKSFDYYDAGLRSDVDILSQIWGYCYAGINQANAVIERAPLVKDPAITDAQKTVKIAEARFLRAHYYFYLVRMWGDIPMPLKETIGVVTEAPKFTQAEVYEQAIIPDLEFAVANLPNAQTDYGRANKGAAEHALGFARLTRGYTSFAKVDDFSTAETYFTNVITNYGYLLTADMAALWNQDNQKSKEIIFAVQNSTNVLLNSNGDGVTPPIPFAGEGNKAHLYFIQQYDIQPGMVRDIANGRPFKRFRPTDYLLNLWATDRGKGGNRYDQTYSLIWISNNAGNIPVWTTQNVTDGAYKLVGSSLVQISAADVGKPRFVVGDTALYIPGPGAEASWIASSWQKVKQTRYKVFTRTPNSVNGPPSTSTNYDTFNFACVKKFLDPRRPALQWTEGSRDWFVFRLADTYLLRAEARFKQGNAGGAVLDINVVRTRAAKAGSVGTMTATTAADLTAGGINYILDERALELDAELCRWFDLVRTNTLVSRVKLYNPLAAPNIQDYHVRRPYPQTQLDRTLPAGTYIQNCGYPGGPPCN